jgi:MFS family permease
MTTTITGPRHDSDWDAPSGEAAAAQRSQQVTRRRVAFWPLAFVFAAAMLGTTLPTPLYAIYQARWHFSAAAFALLGLFSSLVPGFIGGVLHQGSHLVQGAVVFGIFAVGTVTQVALSRFASHRVVLAGLGLFLVALALIVAALALAALALFLAGTIVGGVAVGAIFLGSLATANRLAPPERRGHVISAFFVACYTGLIVPVVGVGVLSGFTGTWAAVLAFSALLAVLCLFSLARIATALAPDPAASR